jgi:hypothetical protein
MTRDDIIRMAREAEFESVDIYANHYGALMRFAALVAAAEREACAHVCLDQANAPPGEGREMALFCAAIIRARGKNDRPS